MCVESNGKNSVIKGCEEILCLLTKKSLRRNTEKTVCENIWLKYCSLTNSHNIFYTLRRNIADNVQIAKSNC